MRATRTLLVGLVGGLVLATVDGQSVSAEVLTAPDSRSDLMRPDASTGDWHVAPELTDFDIIKTRFRHRQHRVRVRMQFVSLPRNVFATYKLRIKTPEGTGWVEVNVAPREKPYIAPPSFRGSSIDCSVHYSADYTGRGVVIGVARNCFGKPKWVQVGAFVTGLSGDPMQEDDALQERTIKHRQIPTLSQRLAQGTW